MTGKDYLGKVKGERGLLERIMGYITGYHGFFDAIKVKEDKLDTVLQYDVGLIEKAESLKADCQTISKKQPGNEDWDAAMDALISKVDEYDSLIDTRAEILRGLGES